MPKIKFQGKTSHIIRSFISLMWIGTKITLKHLFNRPLVPSWSANTEIGIIFWRKQFNHAFSLNNIKQARQYFDSLQTETDDIYKVQTNPSKTNEPNGQWYTPDQQDHPTVILYLHGGGYTFRSQISTRFAEMLCHNLSMRLFMPHYRLTPENPHPAQLGDGLTAYKFLLAKDISPSNIVIIGDSAGGHLALMLLQKLKQQNLPQPALAIGLCAWVDVEPRGKSFFDNDKYDLVQSHMALKFGEWLKGNSQYTNQELSPIYQNYKGLAPIYLQAGKKEIFIDGIKDFAKIQTDHGAEITIDTWPDMTHNFQANGSSIPESRAALTQLKTKILSMVLH